MSKMWNDMSESDKAVWQDKAAKEKAEYQKKFDEYAKTDGYKEHMKAMDAWKVQKT